MVGFSSHRKNWIEKYWFKPLERGDNTHINSGHLIISRELFDEVGGFNEELQTGEDYDISARAKAAGIVLVDDVRLKVIHKGFPEGIGEFFGREFWHGKGDASSLAAILHSKVALVSFLSLVLHVVLLYSWLIGSLIGINGTLICITGISFGASYFKYSNEPLGTILVNSFMYYLYFWARGLSILSLLFSDGVQKRTR